MTNARIVARSPEARAFRTQHVLAAAAQLASEGGYEAVQMREVASRARVAIATLYRYFPSKDDLLRAIISDQVEMLRTDVETRPPTDPTPSERAVEVFIRAFHGITRDRGFAHAAMGRYHSPGILNAEARETSPTERSSFVDIAAHAAWGPDHATTDRQYLALHILESLLNSSIVSWLDGIMTPAYIEERLRFAGLRLLDT